MQGRDDVGAARLRGESGQVLVLVALSIVALIAIAGFAIDVGYAYYSQRALQASADAAALSGAQELPDPDAAARVARVYAGSEGGKNARRNVPGVLTSVQTRCLTSAPGCEPVNSISVTQKATVETIFARVVGIDSFDVSAKATACSPCGSRALDIMLAFDRTGSMCQDHFGRPDPTCVDLNNARGGMREFLSFFDPDIDWVGLAVFPPAPSLSQSCAVPQTSTYNSASAPYVVVPLSKDYSSGGSLNESSRLVSTIGCQQGGGRTSYATAIEHAQAELDRSGRAEVQDVIVLLSDGAANIGPTYYPAGSPYRQQPCAQGVASARAIAARGTIVYTIGYDLNADGGDANVCTASNGTLEAPPITAYQAIQSMASEPSNFFNKPLPGELRPIFTRIAADISRRSARLIPDDAS